MRQRLKSFLALAQFYNWSEQYSFSKKLLLSILDDLLIAMSFHLNLDSLKKADRMKQEKNRKCFLKTVDSFYAGRSVLCYDD